MTQHSGVPPYLQIISQIKQLIASGRLNIDQELLPIRVLAEKLLINPNTVARAYRELETAGWLYTKRGAGTFVAAGTTAFSAESCQKQIRERVRALLAEAEHMNISVTELIKLIREMGNDLGKGDKEP
ncbi:MAG TPA: GntR family transcriptional regulator [Steroidobacteraceae bacterium]